MKMVEPHWLRPFSASLQGVPFSDCAIPSTMSVSPWVFALSWNPVYVHAVFPIDVTLGNAREAAEWRPAKCCLRCSYWTDLFHHVGVTPRPTLSKLANETVFLGSFS